MRLRWIPPVLFVAAALAPVSASADPPPAAGPLAVLQQARAKQAVAAYEEAADGLEKFAAQSPSEKEAPDALLDATVMRLGLGEVDRARADVQRFAKAYGATDPKRAAQAGLAVALHLVDHEDWLGASTALDGWMTTFEPTAALDHQIVAHATLGRVRTKLNDAARAEPEYRKVVDAWSDPARAVKRIMEETGDDTRRLAKALIAQGEARFFFAEKKRKSDVETVRFPALRGSSTREAVLAHLNTKVKDWVLKKRQAIEGAEREYKRIVDIQPEPPPRWVIAAGSRVGQMWGKFVAEFRAAPIPREWKGHGTVPGTTDLTYDELRREWYQKLDEASAPQKATAKAAFATCASYSVKYQYDDDYARACRTWLAKNYRSEYHPIDEIVPRPHLLGDAPVLLAPLVPARSEGVPAAIDAH